MQPIRQGDVILEPIHQIQGKKLSHLTLAKGEVTGHSHRICKGKAELYEENGTLYLRVLSKKALLGHEEHKSVVIPRGDWKIQIQREYQPIHWDALKAQGLPRRETRQDWTNVCD